MPLEMHGADLEVPLVTGGSRRYVYLDTAASAPALSAVVEAVAEFLPWYSSVHRGTGFKSMVATAAYEGARREVERFFGTRPDDVVVFTRNTTDALNLLAASVPDNVRVVAFETEHHANLLPWRRRGATFLPAPRSPADAVALVKAELRLGGPALLAVTGASNVTGELWPVADLVAVAHEHDARVVLDAAQLAPHRGIDLTTLDVDYLAASGHKLYAPFGVGVLIGRSDWLEAGEPFLVGGGAVRFVTTSEVVWGSLPDRQEAGTPNVVGAVALGVACRVLREAGVDTLAAEEHALLKRMVSGLQGLPGLELYSLWGSDHDRIGVVTFNLVGVDYAVTAAALSAEYAVAVRHGCFCAHPLMLRLLGVEQSRADSVRAAMRGGEPVMVPGAVRASLGFGSTIEDVDQFLAAMGCLCNGGPRWKYGALDGGKDAVPVPDPRLQAGCPPFRTAVSAQIAPPFLVASRAQPDRARSDMVAVSDR
ncbi:MAG: aminotransferase class V-fold PLP-dependent enzyme [Acidimicrobiales bacterium]